MSHPLDEHRIAEVRSRTIQAHYPRAIGKNARLGAHGTGPSAQIRELVTDQGARGWGLCGATPENTADIVGRRVSDLIHPAYGVFGDGEAFDLPLHDLAGVILDQPVWRMMGGHGPRTLMAYDGAIYMDDVDPEEAPRGVPAVLANCAQDYDLGYRAFKLKIGRGNRWMSPDAGLKRDIEVTRAVREAYPEAPILVDPNNGYSCDAFLRYLREVVDCKLFWVEEPFHEMEHDLRRLKNYLLEHSPETLIADGEACYHVPTVLDLAAKGLIDVAIMDIGGLGFTAWRRLMPEILEAGCQIAPHTWGHPLKTLYVGQFSAGVGHCLCAEGVPGTVDETDVSAYRFEEGILHMPESAPGFGIRLALAD